MTTKITANFVDAIKVQFLRPIFEEDFPEKGMKAWLVDVEWDQKYECYKLYFDFSDFEEHNAKYFKADYHPNVHTQELGLKTGRKKFTAIEAGQYHPKYDAYFSFEGLVTRDDAAFQRKIIEYLQVA